MNIITDALPDYVEIGDKKFPVLTDFRIWMEFDRIMHSRNIETKDKIMMIMLLVFDRERFDILPDDCFLTMESLAAFYACGKNSDKRFGKNGKRERTISFSKDSGYIYSAFLTQYGIDLVSIPYMHWYLFCALLDGLEESRRIVKIIKWRVCDPDGVQDKERKKFLKKMKELYALPDSEATEKREEEVAEILSQLF